jgi:hypothetical protein
LVGIIIERKNKAIKMWEILRNTVILLAPNLYCGLDFANILKLKNIIFSIAYILL